MVALRIVRLSGKQVRVARLKDARRLGWHTQRQWFDLCEACNWCCVCCGDPLATPGPWRMTKDHISPISLGGSDAIENIQPLCPSCNSRKGTYSTLDFRPWNWRETVFGSNP